MKGLLATACTILLVCVFASSAYSRELLQDAPEQKPDQQYLTYYYYSYSYTYYSYYYRTYYYYGRRLLQDASAPSPASAPLCCPTQNIKQGDTVASLLEASGQPTQDPSFFNALNPDTRNGTVLQAGTTVTVPCYRILAYFAETAPPAPAPSMSGSNMPASGK